MATTKPKSKKAVVPPAELSETILAVARRHFAQHGFQGANLRDIAQEAGVANSLINYHFTDKPGLFRACIERFARARMEAINRILDSEPKSRDEIRIRLELFVEEMFNAVLADPHSFEILDREMRAQNPLIMDLFQTTLLLAFKNVVNFFTQAQRNGLLREGTEPMILAALLFTSTCDTSRKDFMAKKFFDQTLTQPEWRKKFSGQVVGLFLNGVVK